MPVWVRFLVAPFSVWEHTSYHACLDALPAFPAWAQIQEVQSLRVSVSLEYVHLRNQRHRKMRQQLAALWHSQQQHAAGVSQHTERQQQQQPAGDAFPHVGQQQRVVSAGGLQAGSTSAAAAAGAAATGPCEGAAAAAAGGPAAFLATGDATTPHRGHVAVGGQAVGQSVSTEAAAAAATGAAAAAVGGEGWCMQRPGFQHQVLSTVQYMAFVHALQRFFDRAVAVARCAADAHS